MSTTHPYRVNNWFCGNCQRWLATEDLTKEKRHEECQESAKWVPYKPSMDYHASFERRQAMPKEASANG